MEEVGVAGIRFIYEESVRRLGTREWKQLLAEAVASTLRINTNRK